MKCSLIDCCPPASAGLDLKMRLLLLTTLLLWIIATANALPDLYEASIAELQVRGPQLSLSKRSIHVGRRAWMLVTSQA